MLTIKQASLALALLAGTALGAQAQTSGGTSGAMGGTGTTASPGTASGGTMAGSPGVGTTGRGNPMPNNSDIGTGPAGPSVAGRPTSPGTSAPQTR